MEPCSSNESAVSTFSGRPSLPSVDDLVPSLVLGSYEVVKLVMYAMTMKEYLIMAGERVFRRAEGSAALVLYSNDTRLLVQAASNECAAVLCELERVEDKTAATHFECFRWLFAYSRSIVKSSIFVETFCLVWSFAFVLRWVAQATQGCLSPRTRSRC